MNRAGRGEERERRGDDLVPRPDIERAQREQDGVRPVGAADRVTRVRESGDRALEARHRLPQNECLVVDDAHEGRDDVVTNRGVLRAKVEQGNGHG